MTHKLDRRDFIRRLLAVSAAGAVWGMAGCGSRPTPDAATPTSPPTPTRTRLPTAAAIPPTVRAGAATPTTATAENPTSAPTVEPVPSTATLGAAAAAYLAVARGAGADPAELTRRAIAAQIGRAHV